MYLTADSKIKYDNYLAQLIEYSKSELAEKNERLDYQLETRLVNLNKSKFVSTLYSQFEPQGESYLTVCYYKNIENEIKEIESKINSEILSKCDLFEKTESLQLSMSCCPPKDNSMFNPSKSNKLGFRIDKDYFRLAHIRFTLRSEGVNQHTYFFEVLEKLILGINQLTDNSVNP